MNRSLSILMLIAAAFICGCSKLVPVYESECVYASFIVSMDEQTRAAIDDDGAAGSVNRCILQIWKGDEIYKTVVRTAPAGTREYSFNGVALDPEDTYDFLFWADCGTEDGGDLYYSTESLRNVTMLNPEKGNDDAADAFCNRVLGHRVGSEYATRLILRRPLAQLNIITKDLPAIAGMTLAEDFAPKSVSYSYCGCTCFDVREGLVLGEPVSVLVEDAPVYGNVMEDGACTLAMTYIFPSAGESVSAVDVKVRSVNDAVISASCDNVPLKANYRTNIIGNLLTAEGEFSVSLSPMFDGEITAW